MTRIWLSLGAVAALSACAPQENTARGVGFGDYESYSYSQQRARQAQLETQLSLPPENTGAPGARDTAHGRQITQAELAAAGIDIGPDVRVRQANGAVLYGPGDTASRNPLSAPKQVDPIPPQAALSSSERGPRPAAPELTAQGTTGPAPLSALRPGTLAGETGETGAAAPAYSAVQPVAQAPSGEADVVAYALRTDHPVGDKRFNRTFASDAKARRACARYVGTDQAQRAFLEAGGPQRDRLGLDPDGDGYACGWSPVPFRAARPG